MAFYGGVVPMEDEEGQLHSVEGAHLDELFEQIRKVSRLRGTDSRGPQLRQTGELRIWGLVAQFMSNLAPGSYLSLSHLTDDQKPPRSVREFHRVFDHATEQMHFRSRSDVERFFTGLELLSPTSRNLAGDCVMRVTGKRWTQ